MMRTAKLAGIIISAFIAGAFVASPELRAFAAATVTSADIVDNTIQSVDIGNAQVMTADIANDAITTYKIGPGAVVNSDIKDGAISTAKLHNSSVTNLKLAGNSVTSKKIVDNNITAADIATDAVGADKIKGVTRLVFGTGGGSDFCVDFACTDFDNMLEPEETLCAPLGFGFLGIHEHDHVVVTSDNLRDDNVVIKGADVEKDPDGRYWVPWVCVGNFGTSTVNIYGTNFTYIVFSKVP